MSDIDAFDYPTNIKPLLSKNLSWDEKGVNKKSVEELKRFLRSKLRRTFQNTCYFCNEEVNECNSYYDIEHILPKSKKEYFNFTFNPKNLTLSCQKCNRLKGSIDVLSKSELNPNVKLLYNDYPFTADKFEIIHPYLDNYDQHIFRFGIFYLVRDKSDKGFNTIKYYHLARLSLAESKIKKLDKIKNAGLRHILTNGTITNEITINNLLTNNLNNNVLPNTNTTDLTTALDNYLNPLDKKDATKSRINKLKNINQYNLKDFFEFKKLINEMNKRFPDWYAVPSWYNNTAYTEAIKQSICFNRSTDINLILENISTVLNGLKGLFGTTQLRKKLEYVTTRDIYELNSTFHVYFNKQHYNYNAQLELLYPILYALECKKLYNCNDFTNKIGNKLALDAEILEGVKKLFKGLNKRKLI